MTQDIVGLFYLMLTVSPILVLCGLNIIPESVASMLIIVIFLSLLAIRWKQLEVKA